MVNGRVLAGIDGSPAAEKAIRWAAAEAAARGAELQLVHAFVRPLFHVPLGPGDLAPGLRAAADKIVRESVELAETSEPASTVEGSRTDGFPAPVLIQASTDADRAAPRALPSGRDSGRSGWRLIPMTTSTFEFRATHAGTTGRTR